MLQRLIKMICKNDRSSITIFKFYSLYSYFTFRPVTEVSLQFSIEDRIHRIERNKRETTKRKRERKAFAFKEKKSPILLLSPR